MLWRCLSILVVCVWPIGAKAAGPYGISKVPSDRPNEIALTIYADDLALITERRLVYLPAGKSVIAFKGVSDMMIPQSAVLREFTGFTLERNFDFDLITPGALFEGATGETVTIYRTNPATGQMVEKQAKIISGGAGVVMEIDGKYEALKCAGVPERAQFDRVPDGLNPQPTLSIQVSAEEAGEQEVILSYLASGFGWAADYRLDVNDDEKTASLIGWLTVRNRTEVSIEDAATAIIAGDLRRLAETEPEEGSAKGFFARCWPRGSSKTGIPVDDTVLVTGSRVERKSFLGVSAGDSIDINRTVNTESLLNTLPQSVAEQENFGDYKLYRPPGRTTVAAYQEKQLMFLSEPEVDLEKIHAFNLYQPDDYAGTVLPATVMYHLDNSRAGKLGLPLPEGTIRVMTTTGEGRLFYLGQDNVDNLAVDLPAEFNIATAPDVQMETMTINQNRARLAKGQFEKRITVMHTFFNASLSPVEIELKVGEESYTPLKINVTSLPIDQSSATPKWRIKVPPESKRELTYSAAWVE